MTLNTNPPRCLIVEDNQPAAGLMQLFFSRNDIASDIAENGKAGLALYEQNPDKYDVIFADLQMPVMDGYEMTKQIQETQAYKTHAVPIIAMSGTNSGDALTKSGFSCFLKKPFNLSYLLEVLDEVLGTARSEHEAK